METKKLANKLKELRALRGMSQEYLAEESRWFTNHTKN